MRSVAQPQPRGAPSLMTRSFSTLASARQNGEADTASVPRSAPGCRHRSRVDRDAELCHAKRIRHGPCANRGPRQPTSSPSTTRMTAASGRDEAIPCGENARGGYCLGGISPGPQRGHDHAGQQLDGLDVGRLPELDHKVLDPRVPVGLESRRSPALALQPPRSRPSPENRLREADWHIPLHLGRQLSLALGQDQPAGEVRSQDICIRTVGSCTMTLQGRKFRLQPRWRGGAAQHGHIAELTGVRVLRDLTECDPLPAPGYQDRRFRGAPPGRVRRAHRPSKNSDPRMQTALGPRRRARSPQCFLDRCLAMAN